MNLGMWRSYLKPLRPIATAQDGVAVTPNDGADLPTGICRALWIGGEGSGNLKITTADGSELVFAGVPVGFFPVAAKRVWDTGTDVTDIVALY